MKRTHYRATASNAFTFVCLGYFNVWFSDDNFLITHVPMVKGSHFRTCLHKLTRPPDLVLFFIPLESRLCT